MIRIAFAADTDVSVGTKDCQFLRSQHSIDQDQFVDHRLVRRDTRLRKCSLGQSPTKNQSGHRQYGRAAKRISACLHSDYLLAGTRRSNSSNKFSTTSICVAFLLMKGLLLAAAASFPRIMRKCWLS